MPAITAQLPDGSLVQLSADPGVSVSQILARQGYLLDMGCNGQGRCNRCRIELLQGTALLGARRVGQGVWPACKLALADASLKLRIPSESLLPVDGSVVSSSVLGTVCGDAPLWSEPSTPYGIAVDIGTTTVACRLLHVSSGECLAQAGSYNRQMLLGSDVLSRIQASSENPQALSLLRDYICTQTIEPLIQRCLHAAHVEATQLGGLVVAGNTTMQHLLLGVDPSGMGSLPFTPKFLQYRKERFFLDSCEIGAESLHVLPGASAFVGADIIAGLVAADLDRQTDETWLFVDVGTNGEMVLHHNGKYLACATAAGPAFEGCGLRCGMRATRGAVISLQESADSILTLQTLEDDPPVGICGTAYIDFLAIGRAGDWLSETGRFDEDELPQGFLLKEDAGKSFPLHPGSGVLISERDIATLLQAKSAIAAGVATLLAQAGLQAGQVHTLYLAGGFGRYLHLPHALAIGLFPGFTLPQIRVLGNTSLAGAEKVLLDAAALARMQNMATLVETIELNRDPLFEDRFIDHLLLP